MKLADQGPAGEVAVDDNFEDVIMEIGFGEVPEIIVSFVEKIQLVETFDPADFDLYVEIFRVAFFAEAADGIFKLVGADGVGVRDDGPVGGIAVDPGDLVGRELKDFIFHIRTFEAGTQSECAEPDQQSVHVFWGRGWRWSGLRGVDDYSRKVGADR